RAAKGQVSRITLCSLGEGGRGSFPDNGKAGLYQQTSQPAGSTKGSRYGAAVVPKSEAEGGDPEQLLDVAVPSWIENVVRVTGPVSLAMFPSARRATLALATSNGSSRVPSRMLRGSARRQGCSSPGSVSSRSVLLAVGSLPRGSGRKASTGWPPTVSTRA
ncbi:conserved hypothetical protein, partial [Trichinella spiralis]|uniref:hypothetical protein n=1 Tax=Trichinella spiralis TaxID=6334 RepID=UPI0001EFD6D6